MKWFYDGGEAIAALCNEFGYTFRSNHPVDNEFLDMAIKAASMKSKATRKKYFKRLLDNATDTDGFLLSWFVDHR
jgi:hypothetical protein